MEKFIGREKDIEYLEGLYSQKGLVTCAIYGRRQIGKSTLIREFCKGKESLSVQFLDRSSYENRAVLSESVSLKAFGERRIFDSFTDIMAEIETICKKKKTVLVFDEFPFVVNSSPEFPSILQRLIDVQLRDTDTMIIICGSSISIMCNEIKSMKRPLYGRFMNRHELGEIPFVPCMDFHRNMNFLDCIKSYLVLGGVPKYHSMANEKSFDRMVKDNYLSIHGTFGSEAENLITNELPSPVYTGIIACIADGSVAQYEIADKLHTDRSLCKRYLDDLERIRIVERINPMMAKPSRPKYRIADNFVAFYYEVVRKYKSLIAEDSDIDFVYGKMTKDIDTFIGHRFEYFCGKYLDSEYFVLNRGPMWSRNGTVEIDIVANVMDSESHTSNLVCECKFTKKPLGMTELKKLESNAEKLNLENVRFVLFSVSGFNDKLIEYAEGYDRIELVGPDEFVNWPTKKKMK